ncbi:MAG: type III-A CRISPR-associated protein Csm2 [Desulfovibrio sp.]|nr:type III-A CRISPR-associated protein Csm2 [Desulfovibrio sp.]
MPKFEYFKDGAINPELVDKEAKIWADKFVPKSDPRAGKLKIINSAQLRRFYGDVKRLETRWLNSAEKKKTFSEILPMIKLLKAKSAYAYKRDLVPDSFREWIWDNVDQIHEEKDFKAFLLYFEAVVGFCYGNGLRDK